MATNRNPRRGDNTDVTPRLKAPTTGESAASRHYRAGKSYGYKYRIRGPVFPVTITKPTSTLFAVTDEEQSPESTS